VGSNNWNNGTTLLPNQLNNSSNGMLIDWNTAGIPDGSYNLRLKVNCQSGTTYSTRVAGTIDRVGPRPFGKPEPTDDEYKPGDNISVKYNEVIDGNSVNPDNIRLIRLSDNQSLDFSVSSFENQWIIVPPATLGNALNERFKVVFGNISDRFGNHHAALDSFTFIVAARLPDNSNKSISLAVRNQTVTEQSGVSTGGEINPGTYLKGVSTLASGDNAMVVYFDLPAPATNQVRVNFAVGGTAVFGKDYLVRFDSVGTDPNGRMSQANTFNGTTGSIVIENQTRRAILRIDPVNNAFSTPDKTLLITLLQGGDYTLGENILIAGQIINDDIGSIYQFTGTGNFNSAFNWQNNTAPPADLKPNDEVIINPSSGECILNVPLRVVKDAKITVSPGKVLRVTGNVQIQ
jgi:hypothetical protein